MYAASVRHRALMAGDVAGHEFHGNQWTADKDPEGEPQGKLKHAVLVIDGKRYRARSHMMAAFRYAQENPDADMEKLSNVQEGFETESGHFLNRNAAAKYVGSKNERMSSEEAFMEMKAVNGQLYTADAVVGINYSQLAKNELQAGDVAGHEFHGNQWTRGEMVQDYLRDSYATNSNLRHEENLETPYQKAKIEHLDAAINESKPLPSGTKLYRSVPGNYSAYEKLKAGDTFTEKGYASTTVSKRGAMNPGYVHPNDRLLLTIKGAGGTKALDMKSSISKYAEADPRAKSLASGEKEFLLPRGSKFKIVSIDRENGEAEVELLK